jgi:hypothetical protein
MIGDQLDNLEYHLTYQERLRQRQNFVLSKVTVFVLVVQVEEPFNVLHQVIEHDTI